MGAENSPGQPKEKRRNDRLRRARMKKYLTIKAAAKLVGVSEATFTRWEQGDQCPHLTTLEILCKAFDSTPEKLGYAHLIADEEAETRTLEAEMERLILRKQLEDQERMVRQAELARREAVQQAKALRSELETERQHRNSLMRRLQQAEGNGPSQKVAQIRIVDSDEWNGEWKEQTR